MLLFAMQPLEQRFAGYLNVVFGQADKKTPYYTLGGPIFATLTYEDL